ncbi:MAG: DUF6599 family protein [Candidatus Acidiferrales bacterium]
MRRNLCLLVLALFSLAVAVLPARAQGLLPDSFGKWSASSATQRMDAAAVEQSAGADSAVFQEYRIEGAARRAYARSGEAASVALYHLGDPSAAYGLYTFLRSDALAPIDVGSFAGASANRALIVVGNLLIDVTSPRARPTDADLKALAQALTPQADTSPYPTIGESLPATGLVHRSEHYFVGPQALSRVVPLGTDDWAGFDYSAEALSARYHMNGNNDAVLLLISYPTQQIAGKELDGMMRRFPIDPPGGAPAGQQVLYGRRISSLVALVIGAPTRDAANALLDQIHNNDVVTWNEPKQTYSDPSISQIVIEGIMGTGAIMLLCIAAGIGFGGLRVFVKYFFPGKVFDREKQIEVLQLGLASKPIKSKDFY